MYFLIFQSEDMFNLCLSFNELQPNASKRCAYKKEFEGFFTAKK